MTFTKVMVPKKEARTARWVAIWKTAAGNFIHDQLPMFVANPLAVTDAERTAATEYAIANPPVWA